jgi:ribosomal protein S18 acetylase RimI-like enzyme
MYPRYQDHTPAQLARLTEANLYEFLTALAHHPGADLARLPELTRYSDTAIISPMFNGVIGAEMSADRADALIQHTIDYFTARQRPMAFWWVGPSSQPADLGARLLAHGLVEFEIDAPAMAADLHALPEIEATPAGFTIDIVRDARSAQEWGDTFNAIYGTPQFAGQAWVDAAGRFGYDGAPFRLYLGRLHGRPVATNMLAYGAGAAGVLGVGTLPEARGQGIGAAITLQPYLDARASGYHTGVLFATEQGLAVYRRLGFSEVGAISRYLWRAG